MTPVFVDTSVLLAAENTAAGAAHQAALDWLDSLWRQRSGRTSCQALVEFYERSTSACPPLPQGDARAAIRRYQSWNPWKTDAATLETAWAIEARHQLPWGDCLALACAQHSGCELLLNTQLPHGAQYAGVQIVHPALQAPPVSL
ncbi:PIN domain-containing protein [Acidovorax sp. HDW3]|uniref:PIN domain-containing protein n=1 Tax=Acidovorax sp. HDW3 TaxID=2714923 RepID=UPI001F0FB831|nr:PIN domain-containing protein [Acidovorax sp. HDW3]